MDLGFLSELAAGASGLVTGLGIRYFFPRIVIKTVERVIEHVREQSDEPQPAPHCSPNRVIVRFQHADNSADIKRLFKHSLADDMVWAGKQFKLSHTDKNQIHIYKEVEA